jgi:hypothetical protein
MACLPPCCTRAYEPARFKAGTRRTVAFSIVFGALAFILVTFLLSILVDEGNNEAAKGAMTSVTPVCAGFIGAIMAFYFSDEASDGNKDDEDVEQAAPSTRTIMFNREGVFPLVYEFDPKTIEGAKTMKSILEELNSDNSDEPSTSFFVNSEQENGTEDFFFSFKAISNLREKKLVIDEFHKLTLSQFLEMASDSASIIEIMVTFELKRIPIKEATSLLSGITDPEDKIMDIPAAKEEEENELSFLSADNTPAASKDQDDETLALV